jgi:hypothetical protein
LASNASRRSTQGRSYVTQRTTVYSVRRVEHNQVDACPVAQVSQGGSSRWIARIRARSVRETEGYAQFRVQTVYAEVFATAGLEQPIGCDIFD